MTPTRSWEKEFVKEEEFIFDAGNILHIIEEDDVNQSTFSPFSSYSDPVETQTPQIWDQNDYLHIATAFHRWYLGDSSEDWPIFEVWFVPGYEIISDIPRGKEFQPIWSKAAISFYRLIGHPMDRYGNHEVHKVAISNTGDLLIARFRYYLKSPNQDMDPDWGQMDISTLPISAEEAFETAYFAGGYLFQESFIYVENSTLDDFDGWHINFNWRGDRFKIVINDETGQYELVENTLIDE